MLQGKPNRSAGVFCWRSLLRQEFCAWLPDGCGHDICSGDTMVRSCSVRAVVNLGIASALTIFLGACGSMSLPSFSSSSPPPPAPEPGVAPEMPATLRSDEIVGKWGLASFQNPADRARTEKAAQAQCKNPYVIGAGSSGGVIMHL